QDRLDACLEELAPITRRDDQADERWRSGNQPLEPARVRQRPWRRVCCAIADVLLHGADARIRRVRLRAGVARGGTRDGTPMIEHERDTTNAPRAADAQAEV